MAPSPSALAKDKHFVKFYSISHHSVDDFIILSRCFAIAGKVI